MQLGRVRTSQWKPSTAYSSEPPSTLFQSSAGLNVSIQARVQDTSIIMQIYKIIGISPPIPSVVT
jgi:hypothetical protein